MRLHAFPLLAGAWLALAACEPMAGPAGGWSGVPPLSAEDYILMDVSTVGLSGAEQLAEAAAAVKQRFTNGEQVEGNYSETVQSFENDGRGAVVLTQEGIPDDSVRSVQHLVEFDLRPDAQVPGRVLAVATGYGTRLRCYRAPDPDAWTNEFCP
ncbi:hypothetical protein [Paracoccus spongiarum]|uniref:Lipoprotein n=1 Tax=Paracoccus spongiarum TaxID=3064387 RepID=A0ABT9J798_9RHOB|nr:hypothetical protein [Paracoccus sp. 2205BS29-5]MDP5305684.1 hypothetical protein [Paracoccus sp. 2205BS29-5]